MSPPDKLVNLNELERLLLTNWTKFINPQRMIAFVLAKARDANLPALNGNPPSKSIKITLSQFKSNKDKNFVIWVEFIVPQKKGVAVGTCELELNPFNGNIDCLQVIGNILYS